MGIVKESSFKNVIVDTTVMEKNIAYPTDARLYYKSLRKLVREAKRYNITLRQTYTFLSKQALRKTHQYTHARQMKRAKREMRRLRTYLGRVHRDVERKIAAEKRSFRNPLMNLLKITNHILHQQRTDKEKIYCTTFGT